MEIKNDILTVCKGIKNCESFVKLEPISKGLSGDKTYYAETSDGRRLLLRISDISEYERKKAIFNMMKRVAASGVNMPLPVDFGKCGDGKSVYQLLTWCDGKDLEAVLPALTEAEQYKLGQKAGQTLRKIHSIPAPEDTGDARGVPELVVGEEPDVVRVVGIGAAFTQVGVSHNAFGQGLDQHHPVADDEPDIISGRSPRHILQDGH
jgi:hypothetical protein